MSAPFCTSHLDAPAPGSSLTPGRHVLRGWVWPQPGEHIVDVRARVAGRAFPAIHGRPRADLAEHFKIGRRYALAEFFVTVDFPPDFGEVVLEALVIEGHWRPFQTVSFRIEGEATPPPPTGWAKPLHWHDFARGLDFLLRTKRTRPDASWARLASELASSIPVNQDLLHPPQPFIGHADEPAVANSSRFGLLPVVGYLFHTTEKIKRLWVTAELQTLQPLILGRATANIVPHFPDYPNAAVAGYEGYVDVPPQLPNPVVLRLYAETEKEPLQLVQVRTTRRHDAEIEKYPFTDNSPATFDEALAHWRHALRLHGFRVIQDEGVAPAIDRVRTEFVRPMAVPTAAFPRSEARPLRHAFLASHNLNLEGAPLFLLDLAKALTADGLTVTVLSPADGALRPRFEAVGARIQLVEAVPVFRATTAAEAESALNALRQSVDFSAADLVITNTFTAFWAVHAAKAAGRPVLSYVHESTSPAAFYRNDIPAAALALAESALVAADAVSFTSEATRRYHALPGRNVRAVLTPGWVDLAWIDGWLARHAREDLRTKLGVQPGELLVTNVGTICDRKGQLGFARAVALFNQRHPELAQRTRFILLGGRDSWFDGFLRDTLGTLALPNLTVHQETPDFLGYYAAANVTVCSSLEESSPRVVLETMACGTPLLASDIPGISEMARHGEEAELVTPGHTTAWADALARVLADPASAQARARRARQRVETHYAAGVVLPAHLALARSLASGQSLS